MTAIVMTTFWWLYISVGPLVGFVVGASIVAGIIEWRYRRRIRGDVIDPVEPS